MAASAPKPISGIGKTTDSVSSSKSPSKDSGSAFPPMSSIVPKPLFGAADKTSDKEQSKPKPSSAQKEDVSSESKKDTMGFGGMFASLSSSTPSPFGADGGVSMTSSASTAKAGNATFSASAKSGSSATHQKDYHKILTDFYQKHNPAKVSEVSSNLEKYKGKEEEMFARLAQKYKTKNPLEDDTPQQAAPSLVGFGSSLPSTAKSPSPFALAPAPASQASPFGGNSEVDKAKPFSSFGAQTNTPFGSSASKSPFGSSGLASTPQTATPFGNSATKSPFGSGVSSTPAAPFGAASTGFGAAGSSFAQGSTPFGNTTFGSTAAPAPAPATNHRDLLVNFYTTHNPSKLLEVDKTLAKYAGNEELLFLNLAKKYNVDPAQFGVNAAAPGFGSNFGAAPSFGSPAPFLGGGAASTSGSFGSSVGFGAGGGVFGASGGFSGASSGSTFGSLAAAGSGSAFGGVSASFGAVPSTPFGAARW